jgi:hypothetical protein
MLVGGVLEDHLFMLGPALAFNLATTTPRPHVYVEVAPLSEM